MVSGSARVVCRPGGWVIRVRHGADGLADRPYDQDQRLSIGVHYLGRHSRSGGNGRRMVSTHAAGWVAAGGLGGDQSQNAAEGSAVVARLHATRDAAERVLLPALFDDDPGHLQRADGDSAVEADRAKLRLRQIRDHRRYHRPEFDRAAESSVEWLGAPFLWLGLRSSRPLRYDGYGFHPRSCSHYGAHPVG